METLLGPGYEEIPLLAPAHLRDDHPPSLEEIRLNIWRELNHTYEKAGRKRDK